MRREKLEILWQLRWSKENATRKKDFKQVTGELKSKGDRDEWKVMIAYSKEHDNWLTDNVLFCGLCKLLFENEFSLFFTHGLEMDVDLQHTIFWLQIRLDGIVNWINNW